MNVCPTFRVLLVGAGEVNFGSVEGPWNHSARLEKKLGSRLQVVALVDPDMERARAALKTKENGYLTQPYKNTQIYPNISSTAESLPSHLYPALIILGVPPQFRGTDIEGHDLELQILHLFPRCAVFIEKPLSIGPPEGCRLVAEEFRRNGNLTGVGYVLRYLKAVQKIKEIITQNNLVVMGTNARYIMAYEFARKLAWWDKTLSGGPIIEQATHFCDLSRYFGGEIVLESVTAHTVEHDETPGRLSCKRFNEDLIPPENRIPRLTTASWKYKSGAVGSLTHVISLHGTVYDTEFEVYADGYRFKLVDPYNSPTLYVRHPGLNHDEVFTYHNDDPFYSEISAFVEATQDSEARKGILSSYEDAILTHEFTCQIRKCSDLSARIHKELE